MAIRFTPVWDDGSGTPITSGSYDTEQEAADAGREAATTELTFLGVAYRLGHTDLKMHAARLHQRTEQTSTVGDGHRHSGLITRWVPGETSGFVTDHDGRSWFVSRDDLPEGQETLPVGTRITFAGSHHPSPGKKYPRARSVRLASP